MSTGITYDDIRKFDSSYTYWTHAKKAVAGAEHVPGKKKFRQLIKKASQLAPKAQDKPA